MSCNKEKEESGPRAALYLPADNIPRRAAGETSAAPIKIIKKERKKRKRKKKKEKEEKSHKNNDKKKIRHTKKKEERNT